MRKREHYRSYGLITRVLRERSRLMSLLNSLCLLILILSQGPMSYADPVSTSSRAESASAHKPNREVAPPQKEQPSETTGSDTPEQSDTSSTEKVSFPRPVNPEVLLPEGSGAPASAPESREALPSAPDTARSHSTDETTASREKGAVSAEEDAPEEESWGDEAGEWGASDAFEGLSEVKLKPSEVDTRTASLHINGFVRSQWAMWSLRPLEESWAKGRQSLDLSASYNRADWFAKLEGHIEYDSVYDLSSQDFDSTQREAYHLRYINGIQSIGRRFKLGSGSISLSTGRQIITWGEGDGLSALDLINPQDQREPGVSELTDLRLAVWLSRVQIAQGEHTLELIGRHEGHYGILVPPRADYSPFNTLLNANPAASALLSGRSIQFAHDREGISTETQSFFLRYLYRGQGADFGIYYASLLDLRGVLGPLDLSPLQDAGAGLTLSYQHPRYQLVGISFAQSLSSFLLKGELVASLGQSVNVGEGSNPTSLEIEQVDVATGVLSLSYSGITDTTFAVEYQRGALIGSGPESPFFFPPDIDIIAIRANTTLLREKLLLSAVVSMIAPKWSSPQELHQPERGGLLRVDATYRLLDQLKLNIGYVHYLSGDTFGPFYGLEKHDRLFAQLRWDFNVFSGL